MSSNRRQFERLSMQREAIALNEAGLRLGFVEQVGGGGMSVLLDSGVPTSGLVAGTQMRITVVEPLSNIRHTVPVEVRYVTDGVLGLAFATLAM
ncbi:MAG TPA: PilZ domain-containing protein [Terriglobales bacterium]|nr:PilZ domain-containing protein [Terriglobales bacterium]